jgi:hypothetical protein
MNHSRYAKNKEAPINQEVKVLVRPKMEKFISTDYNSASLHK